MKAATAMIEVYQRAEPPRHLFLGSDAVDMACAKQDEVQREIAAQRSLSVSTDL